MLTAGQYAHINLLFRSGLSRRRIRHLTGHDLSTIRKVLRAGLTPSLRLTRMRKKKLDPFRAELEERLAAGGVGCKQLFEVARLAGYRGSLRAVSRFARAFRAKQFVGRKMTATFPCGASLLSEDHFWMLRLIQGEIEAAALRADCGDRLSLDDAEFLVERIREGRLGIRNRAVVLAAFSKGVRLCSIAPFLCLHKNTVRVYWLRFHKRGIPGVFDLSRKEVKKVDDRLFRDAVFKILHAPPSSFGFNRTTWRMADLKSALAAQGLLISRDCIRRIIRNAGFRFRKAKKVLTSNDPDYRRKLQEITAILQKLKPNEKFFSIDEFGPIAVKIQGGRSLVKAGETRTVPQRQRSKGRLICTAALELSENQVTHFYSDRKNTDEMLKLLEILLKTHADQACIYFSWDAASWHASKKLFKRVDEINSAAGRAVHPGPRVTLAPLPACAQFLNVIESVFSGMARAVIHNSDYSSVPICMAAIDRHFAERNRYFKEHPKRAGKKLWGKELVPAVFSEAQNCKDPAW